MSKRLFLLVISLLCVVVFLAACGNTEETPMIPPPEDISGIPGDVLIPDTSGAATSEPETTEVPSTPTATESVPANVPANNSAEATTSRPPAPPASTAPAQTQQQPATPTPAPTTSVPPPTQSAKPTYTEADYQRIIDTIRAYGEAKGFVWEDSFAFGQAGLGYYARPNLERDGYDGVINMLKYNCDTILAEGGICYFKVVKHIYENQTEFIVLYG